MLKYTDKCQKRLSNPDKHIVLTVFDVVKVDTRTYALLYCEPKTQVKAHIIVVLFFARAEGAKLRFRRCALFCCCYFCFCRCHT